MKLYHYTLATNFGDELNPWLWSRLLPEVFNDDASSVFVGIGTLLNDRIPAAGKTAVFGSGVGYGELPCVDDSWKFYCVRGPLTADRLGISHDYVVTDPGILVSRFVERSATPKYKYTFMPHGANANEAWKKICSNLGFGYIDAYDPVDKVLAEIGNTEVLITEAMHGAIVADAMRVPWIPVFTTHNMLEFKWKDWCATIGVELMVQHAAAVWSEQYANSLNKKFRHLIKTKVATKQLKDISQKVAPTLSENNRIPSLLERLDVCLEQFKTDVKLGMYD